MADLFGQTDNTYSGGADIWDDENVGPILLADYFELPPISAVMAAQETGSDTASGSANAAVTGTLAAQESGGDTAAAAMAITLSAALTATETGQDVFAGTATVASTAITGSMSAQETGSDITTITMIHADLQPVAAPSGTVTAIPVFAGSVDNAPSPPSATIGPPPAPWPSTLAA